MAKPSSSKDSKGEPQRNVHWNLPGNSSRAPVNSEDENATTGNKFRKSRKSAYFSWNNRYGEKAPNNSQDSLVLTDEDDYDHFDNRLYLEDTKSTNILKMQRELQTNKNDAQDVARRKYIFQSPVAFGRNEKVLDSSGPNENDDPVVQESTKKHVELMDMRRRLKKGFRFMHSLFIISGLVMVFGGFFANRIISDIIERLDLKLADQAIHLYIGSGCAIIVMSIIGQIIVSVHRFKILTWLIYLLILCLGACSTGSAGYTCLKSYRNHVIAQQKLNDLMNYYNGKQAATSNATVKWDAIQLGYKCCGILNFTDWNESPYGRTSLRVPTSCCRNNTNDEFCGQNLLPDTASEIADDYIYSGGCLQIMMHNLDMWYLITGLYAALISFFIGIHWLFCFFLITSHRL